MQEETIVLSPFEVNATKDTGYQATETLAGTRIKTDLRDVGGAISVITKEFMQDIGATDQSTLLQYTPNAEVAGTHGTYAGLGNGTSVDESGNLRAPGGAQRVRGLAAADNTRDFFITDIPWDTFNVDRIDIQRGPNAILFGLGSPAGIVNATTRNAEFRNMGNLQFRTGSYGSVRSSLDLNQELIKGVLALRVDGLWKNDKYQQQPAFQNDTRFYGALRFDPQLFKDRTWRTSLKARFEHGNIDANRPRTVTPNDSISPWFRPMASSYSTWTQANGMGKTAVDNGYDANRSNIDEIIAGNALGLHKGMQTNNANNPNFQPWLSTTGAVGINQQQPFWLQEGSTGATIETRGGWINPGARTSTGAFRTATDGLAGRFYADQFFGLNNMSAYATTANIPLAGSGQYRVESLQDPTVFDFYNNLIDGNNKWEKEKWDAFNIDLSQLMFNDRLGIQLTYDRQKYKRSNEMELGASPTISIDILKNFADFYRTSASGIGTTNPNFGKPYVAVASGGVGNSFESDRQYVRGSIFGEVRAADFLQKDGLAAKILGKHRFNGVYSHEKFFNETRGWNRLAVPLDWNAYWNGNTGTGTNIFDRPVTQIIYLGGSLASKSSAAGAYIPRVTGDIDVPSNSSVSVFDSTWTNFGVGFGDPWTVPSTLAKLYDTTNSHTQNENPANYRGWTTYPLNLMRYDNGKDQSLTTSAAKAMRETTSYAGSWQGFLWNESIIPTLGWRFDTVKGKDVSAPNNLARTIRDLNPSVYKLPDVYPANQIFKDHSTSGGVVVHLNRLLGERDILPINVSLSYNKSDNFQVSSTRRDVYGHVLGNPTGSTKDYGVLLSTKDGKYSLRAIKFDTAIKDGSGGIDPGAVGGFIAAGLRWRNIYLYKLSAYEWKDREQPRSRNTWGGAANSLDSMPSGQGSPADTSLTYAEGRIKEDAAIKGWNEIQAFATSKGLLDAWGLTNMIPLSVLTDRTTYENTKPGGVLALDPAAQYQPPDVTSALPMVRNYAASRPQGLSATSDTQSKGYEFELTANPLPNLRVAFNASQTEATRTNVGGEAFKETIAFLDSKVLNADGTPNFVGQLPQFGNLGLNWYLNQYAQFRGSYEQMKLQEGTASPEVRKWRYNATANYTFTHGMLKGVGVGASYNWQDKVVIGYPVARSGAAFAFDLNNPVYGPSEDSIGLWVSYERKLSQKINWRIQANVTNLGQDDRLIPISVQPDGKTWASVRIAPNQEWFITNTFSF